MADTSCPLCWGLGEVIREDAGRNNRLFCWPCPFACPASPTPGLIRTTVTPQHAARMTQRVLERAQPPAAGNPPGKAGPKPRERRA